MGTTQRRQSRPRDRIKKVELARRLGVSQPYISRLLREGVIRADTDGLIDVAQAERDLEENRDPRRPRRAQGVGGNGAPAGTGSQGAKLINVRIVRESYLAKQAQLDYERSIKKLIDANEVKAFWFDKARTLRDMLLNLKDRLPPLVAKRGEPACRKVIGAEVDDVLKKLMQELHAGP